MAIEIGLSGHVAVVTGGARGLGWAIAARLDEAGARVVVVDVLDEPAGVGPQPDYLQADISDEDVCCDLSEALCGETLLADAGRARLSPW
jgi:NAD(P)-dependent dehydrogenase (short-subunit alcohol dehydrogenase family)